VSVELVHGDALEAMRGFPDGHFTAVVTDPPYGLEFMGQAWDTFRTGRAAAYARGGAVEERGDDPAPFHGPEYVKRPAKRCARCGRQAWSGNPCTCPEPEWTVDNSPLRAFGAWCEAWTREAYRVVRPGGVLLAFGGARTGHRLACALEDVGWEYRDTLLWLYAQGFPKSLNVGKAIDRDGAGAEAAARWAGHGTALKPAYEPVALAFKPRSGTYAENAIAHGCAGLNLEAAAIPARAGEDRRAGWASQDRPARENRAMSGPDTARGPEEDLEADAPRWPSNVVLEDLVAARLEEAGELARFFYTPKATAGDRTIEGEVDNPHPTVKPTDLMAWLVRLVKMPGGATRILDPFAGSGSTLLAAAREQVDVVGVEREERYVELARRRLVADCPLFANVTVRRLAPA
jgi:DNA modification methylase